MDNNRKKELLKKFADRTLSRSEEQEFWDMAARGEHLSVEDNGAELDIPASPVIPDDIEASLTSVRENLSARIAPQRRKPVQRIYRLAAGIAAMLLIIGGIKGYFYYHFIQDTQTFITVEAGLGSTRRVILPDSSSVTISAGSAIRYPKAFAVNERKVYMQSGEAFFQVTKNRQKPFRVTSGQLQTTALGTSFTVAYNPVFQWVKVNLYTGKVSVVHNANGDLAKKVLLTPGKSYEYADGKQQLGTFIVTPANPLEKGLVFKRTSFYDAVQRIAACYRVHIVFNEQHTQMLSVNGDFNGQSLNEILNSIAFINQLKFKKTDSITYTFMKKSSY